MLVMDDVADDPSYLCFEAAGGGVAQTVADRPQRTLSVQKLNYSERKKKMGVADQNPEQIPDHRLRPRHQHQRQHQPQHQPLSQPKKNQRRNRMTIGVK